MTEQNSQQESTEGASEQPVRRPLRRRWWFWVLVLAGVLLLLPVLLIALVLAALHSETGTAWVIDQIPGLQTEADQGSLLGQWQAERLDWQGYGVTVQVDNPVVAWSPGCLLEKTLCLDTLHAERIVLDIQPGADAEPGEPGAIQLPEINLPLAVVVRDVSLGTLTLNGNKVWDHVALSARGSGASVTIDEALYQLDELRISAQGRAEMRRDWPLDFEVSADIPPPRGEAWVVGLDLTGSVRDLRISGLSRGYLDADFSGSANPLDPRLPAELRLNSHRFLAHDSLPPTLELQDWVLALDGSLANGFRTDLNGVLPGTTGDIQASVRGRVSTQGVSDLVLALTGPAAGQEAGTGTLEVRGQASWSDSLSAEADIDAQRFPWYGLLPELAEPPVVIERLQGRAAYGNEAYNANLEVAVSGPQGDAELGAALEGDLESLRIHQLDMTTGAGTLAGEAELAFAGPLAWQAQLRLMQFNPGYWVPMLEASLNGQVTTEGQLLPEGVPRMTASWDLTGQWQQETTVARGQLNSDGREWIIDDLLISVAENRIEGSGRYGPEIGASLVAQFPRPDRLLPGLEGRLEAEVQLAGKINDPTGTVRFQAQDLKWQDTVAVDQVDLDADLAAGGVLSSVLSARAVSSGGQELEEVSVSLNGTQQRHELVLEAVHEEVSLLLSLAGGLDDQWAAWDGALTGGEVEIPGPGQTWQLTDPATLTVSSGGQASLGQHCWRWQDSTVCAQDQRLWPDTRLAYQIRQFPVQALEPLLPETFRWDAFLDADVDLALTDAGPEGEIRLDAGAGGFEFLVLDEWERLEHQRLTVALQLNPDLANLTMALEGPQLGVFTADVSINPMAEGQPIEGRFNLSALDLSLAQAMAGLEEASGSINGEGRLSGPLMRPQVFGEVALTDGRFFDPGLPLPMNNVVLVLEFLGDSADISGRWQSNDRSYGQLGGNLDWAREPELNLNISGERLPVTYEPFARLEIEPDLNIRFRDGELSIAGQVAVPRGDIEIPEIPESAVSVSEDEVIIGVEREQPTIRSMPMDVTVIVGQDRVTFDAFGITGDLEGTLRIGNNMDARGALQLVNGQFEQFGQELELRRARVQFVGPLAEPYLDIEAVRTVGSVVAGIRLSGPVNAPETEVFSEPSMPQSDALSYLVLGRPPGAQGGDGQMSQAAISLGLTQASKVTRGIGDDLGIQEFTLEAEGSGDQASVVASGYITDELSLRYGVGIFEPITTVALRYDLGRYFYLEAASGLAASLDIFYTRDF